MIIKKEDVDLTEQIKPRGGTGIIKSLSYLKNEDLNNAMHGFNVMELEVNSSIGFHQHIGNEEIYFIISGKGLVQDNDKEEEVTTGDLIYTAHQSYHGLKNIGNKPLIFVAFIIGI